ncbi:hypothetical protein QE374_002997 [Microbacterium sp. SORGH_AS428]|nr:hypothetical protein [Microbacterium sp. SORGH_AS_0428]
MTSASRGSSSGADSSAPISAWLAYTLQVETKTYRSVRS